MSWTRRRVAAAVGATALVSCLAFANAANFPLAAQTMTAAEVVRPCPGTAPVTNGNGPPFSTVSVTVPQGCAGLNLTLRLSRTGSTTRTGSATVAGSGATVVTLSGTFNPTLSGWTVLATVGGWNLPTTWSYTPPPPPPYIWCTVIDASGATCTATVTIFTGFKPGGSSSATYYDVVVTTTSTSYVQWEVGFNFEDDFYSSEPIRLGNSTLDGYNDGATAWTANNVDRESDCSELPLLLVRGHDVGDPNNFEDLKSDRLRQFSLVVNRTDYGYHDVIEPGC